jgi:PAS domain S-box-containing protein
MHDFRLSDLLDLTIVQKMADAHYRAAGMPIGIIDAVDGSILVGSGWQDICLKFHRANPKSRQRCRESDDYIKNGLIEGQACHYKCKNGLWDIGIPIVVAGSHLATLFLGQFFYQGEVPNREFFTELALEFGFVLDDYLAALDRVPVFSREKVDTILEYDKALASFIADLGTNALMKIEADKIIRTERRRSEEKIKRQAEFLQILMDAMPYPVFYKDRRGRYLGCNRSFEQFFRISQAQITGKTVHDIAPRELADVYQCADDDLFKHPGTQAYEATVQSLDGVRRDVLFHKATFEGPDGGLAGIVGAVIDISARKRAEDERQKLQEELALARKMESIGRLAGGVAHDFNNMLGVIIGNAELALEKIEPTHPLQTNLEEIRNAATRSADLTGQLLAFARKQTAAPKVLELNATIENMLTMLRRLVGEHITLTWAPARKLWPVKIDPAQIDQILVNLVVNARDSIAEVGTISIETGNLIADDAYCSAHADLAPGEYIMLAARDSGCGMDKETLTNIFEPFFTTKEKGQRTGLGLATVYGIVKQNRGAITADSKLGEGTTFKIYLPRHEGQINTPAAEKSGRSATGGSETVLLVEDEPTLLEMTQFMLEKLGYTVLAATTPGEAIRLAHEKAGEIDLLITDVVMPEMNGRELAQRLVGFYPKLKQLFMSGYTADVIARHGVLESGIHFVHKPFSMNDLAGKVREALHQS